jgi:lysophospholipase L1-like esterase
MTAQSKLKKALFYVLFFLLVPLVFFGLTEIVLRVAEVNTEIIKDDNFQVGVPMWAMDEANFAVARDVYRQILDNELPAGSADWLQCFEDAKYVHYRMKPGFSGLVTNTVNRAELDKGIKVYMEASSIGFRTKEIPKKKAQNAFRIFVMGDSTAFGWGVNQEERYSELLEKKLNEVSGGLRYEVYNFGIPGYSSYHGRRQFDHYVLKYSPDMVILSFGANDSRKVPQDVKKVLRQSAFIENLKDFLAGFKTYRFFRKIVFSIYNPFDKYRSGKQKVAETEEFVTTWEFQQNLEHIIRTGRENGVETVLLGLCCPIDYLSKMSAVADREGARSMDGMHILLQKLPCLQAYDCYEKMVRYFEELYGRTLLENRRMLYVTSDTCHPNRLGHQILAEALYERLFKQNINGGH